MRTSSLGYKSISKVLVPFYFYFLLNLLVGYPWSSVEVLRGLERFLWYSIVASKFCFFFPFSFVLFPSLLTHQRHSKGRCLCDFLRDLLFFLQDLNNIIFAQIIFLNDLFRSNSSFNVNWHFEVSSLPSDPHLTFANVNDSHDAFKPVISQDHVIGFSIDYNGICWYSDFSKPNW